MFLEGLAWGMKAKQAGILSAILAATCCIGSLLLVAIGLGSGAAFVGRYHWFFLIGGIAVLTWAWAKYLREKTVCECEHKPMAGRRRGMITLLLVTVLVLGFAGLNVSRYLFASAPGSGQIPTQIANGVNRVVIPLEGVDCVTCEIAVPRWTGSVKKKLELPRRGGFAASKQNAVD
jgi:hypothetical protein